MLHSLELAERARARISPWDLRRWVDAWSRDAAKWHQFQHRLPAPDHRRSVDAIGSASARIGLAGRLAHVERYRPVRPDVLRDVLCDRALGPTMGASEASLEEPHRHVHRDMTPVG
jgi:hypothetical protein